MLEQSFQRFHTTRQFAGLKQAKIGRLVWKLFDHRIATGYCPLFFLKCT